MRLFHPPSAKLCKCSEKHATTVAATSRKARESRKPSKWRKETSLSRLRRKVDPKVLRKFHLSS